VRLLAVVALLVFAASAFAQTKPALPVSDMAGEWHGQWTSPSGYLFAATLSLKVAPDGIADGRFVWTLKRSPLADEQRKLGMSATEFVSGKVDGAAGTLTLAGTRKDDPNDVIFTDLHRAPGQQADAAARTAMSVRLPARRAPCRRPSPR
jgi:hypothetical protein